MFACFIQQTQWGSSAGPVIPGVEEWVTNTAPEAQSLKQSPEVTRVPQDYVISAVTWVLTGCSEGRSHHRIRMGLGKTLVL